MISLLRGKVLHTSSNVLTLDVHGVGYEVFCTSRCLALCVNGAEITVVIHTDVKEDQIRLYGFEDQLEKQVFLLLTRVKGVGTKSSSDIVSKVEKIELLRTIAAGDVEKLRLIKGIGKKTAERIIVELKDKVGEYVMENQSGGLIIEREISTPSAEAIDALMALGFSRKDAERSVSMVESSRGVMREAGEIVREALRFV